MNNTATAIVTTSDIKNLMVKACRNSEWSNIKDLGNGKILAGGQIFKISDIALSTMTITGNIEDCYCNDPHPMYVTIEVTMNLKWKGTKI